MTFDIQEILDFLPHRYPFLLIDRVVEFEPHQAPGGDQERDHQRAVFPGTFSRLSHHARRAGGGSHGAGRRHHHDGRDAGPRRKAGGVHRDRAGQVPPPGDAGRPVAHRGGCAVVPDARRAHCRAGRMVDGKLACEATLTCLVVPREREQRGARRCRSETAEQRRRGGGASEHSSQRGDRRGSGGSRLLHGRAVLHHRRRMWCWARTAR